MLLAGDLFHDNRPSRDCLYQVMALLREYTLGDKPIEVELLSDPNEGSAGKYSCVSTPLEKQGVRHVTRKFQFPCGEF